LNTVDDGAPNAAAVPGSTLDPPGELIPGAGAVNAVAIPGVAVVDVEPGVGVGVGVGVGRGVGVGVALGVGVGVGVGVGLGVTDEGAACDAVAGVSEPPPPPPQPAVSNVPTQRATETIRVITAFSRLQIFTRSSNYSDLQRLAIVSEERLQR